MDIKIEKLKSDYDILAMRAEEIMAENIRLTEENERLLGEKNAKTCKNCRYALPTNDFPRWCIMHGKYTDHPIIGDSCFVSREGGANHVCRKTG